MFDGAFDSLEQMLVATCEAVRPPERLTVSEAAEKYRYLDNPGSYQGFWDNTIAPYLVEPMDTLTSLDFEGMVFAGPARTGKSDMFFNWLTYSAKCDPADMMVVHMTRDTARDWSIGDLRKVFRHSPEVGARVVPGRQNTNVHDVRFLNGMRLLIKWPTITELSGKTIPRLWVMDYDRLPADIDKEGSAWVLTKKRAQTYQRFGMTVAESSPGFDVTDPKWMPQSPHQAPPCGGILAIYNTGDRRRWYWRCPYCQTAFEPDFHLLVYPDSKDKMEAAEAAELKCPHCDVHLQHSMKHELNIGGRWIKDGQIWRPDGSITGTPARSDIASFWLKGAAAAFQSWRGLVLNYLNAMEDYQRTGSQEMLKATINTDQGLPYSPKGLYQDLRLPEQLKERANPELGEKVVPDGVRFLIATADVQNNRFVIQVLGIKPAPEALYDLVVVDRFEIRKSARLDEDGERFVVKPGAYVEDWKLLIKQVLLKTYPLADGSGRSMQIKMFGCDSGGSGKKDSPVSTTSNAYNFWRFLRDGPAEDEEDDSGWVPGLHRRMLLVKGEGAKKAAPRVQIRYPDSDRKDRHAAARGEIPVLFINSDMVKDMVSNMLDRDTPGGQIEFPSWLPDTFYAEMLAEVRTDKGWENPTRARNEAFDLTVYCVALLLCPRVGIERVRWEEPPSWAADWDENDLVVAPDGERRFTAKRSEVSLEELGAALA